MTLRICIYFEADDGKPHQFHFVMAYIVYVTQRTYLMESFSSSFKFNSTASPASLPSISMRIFYIHPTKHLHSHSPTTRSHSSSFQHITAAAVGAGAQQEDEGKL